MRKIYCNKAAQNRKCLACLARLEAIEFATSKGAAMVCDEVARFLQISALAEGNHLPVTCLLVFTSEYIQVQGCVGYRVEIGILTGLVLPKYCG